MLERNGRLIAQVVRNTSKDELTPVIIANIKRTATLYTDEWQGYNVVDKLYRHSFVDHSIGQYGKGDVTTNAIEGFWTLLKRGFMGIYHYMSRKHLQRYVDEFVFRYNTRKMSDRERFILFLCNLRHNVTNKELIAV